MTGSRTSTRAYAPLTPRTTLTPCLPLKNLHVNTVLRAKDAGETRVVVEWYSDRGYNEVCDNSVRCDCN